MSAADPAPLGDTGVALTRLGHGGSSAGNLYRVAPDERVNETLNRCLEVGVRWFDSAPHYGLGLSERRLGAHLGGRDDIAISTKVGRLLEPVPGGPPPDTDPTTLPADQLDDEGFAVPRSHVRHWDFSVDGVRASLAASRERLGRDVVDVALLHDPEHHMDEALTTGLDGLEAARRDGEVRAVGAGMNFTEPLTRLVRTGRLDVAMIAGRYTLLEQPALDGLLPAALETRTAVVVVGVFNSGLLARAEVPDDATYDYQVAPPAVVERARRLAAACREFDVPLPAAALHLPLAHPAVAAILVGTSRPEHVSSAAAWLDREIPAQLWGELRRRGLLADDVPTPEQY